MASICFPNLLRCHLPSHSFSNAPHARAAPTGLPILQRVCQGGRERPNTAGTPCAVILTAVRTPVSTQVTYLGEYLKAPCTEPMLRRHLGEKGQSRVGAGSQVSCALLLSTVAHHSLGRLPSAFASQDKGRPSLQPPGRCHPAVSTAPAPRTIPSYLPPALGWLCLISTAWLLPSAADVGSLRVRDSRWAHRKEGGGCRPAHFQGGCASKVLILTAGSGA